ncbi:UvrD-like helicase, ATP-binding domain, P-loop containing nucleoside triphosphate hydrolase [Tanacetum coccineum]
MAKSNDLYDVKIYVRSSVKLLGEIKDLLERNPNRERLFRRTIFGPWLDILSHDNDNHLMVKSKEDDSTCIRVKASQPTEFQDRMLAVFLMNVTSQKRIWNSLHVHRNLEIIKEVLYSDSKVKEKCDICSFGYDSILCQKLDPHHLNESQKTTVMAALCKTRCCHTSYVEQIWGPPGTGKTLTASVLLFIFLQMKQRTLTCASTNVAILQLASRMLSLVRESSKTTIASGDFFCSVGDLLLFGSKERLEVNTDSDIEEIYIEHRVKSIAECLGPVTGWKHCIRSMIDLLENCVSEYYSFVENEFLKEKQLRKENEDLSKSNFRCAKCVI